MKRSLIYGGVFSFAACSFLFSSCSADKEELESMMDGKSSVSFTAVVDEVSDALRAAWDVVDPGVLVPDYSKDEIFRFTQGDQLVALSQGETKTYAQEGIEVNDKGHVTAKLYSNGYAWFFYPSVKINKLDTATAVVKEAYVTLTIDREQDFSNQTRNVFLKTNPMKVVDGKIDPIITFNHLTSLLRFHVLNQTGNANLVVNEIKLEADDFIFPLVADYNIASQETTIDEFSNFQNMATSLTWKERFVQDETKAKMTYVDSLGMSGYIYDALLVTFPISAATLAKSTLSVSVTFYDRAKGTTITPAPVTYTPAKLAGAFPNGWPMGTRSYFNVRINENNELSIDIDKYPGNWGTESAEIDVVK